MGSEMCIRDSLKAGLEFRIEVLDQTASWKKAQEKQHEIALVGLGVGVEMYPRFWDTMHSDNAYDDAFLEDGSVNLEREVKVQTNNMEMVAIHEMDQIIDRYTQSSDRDAMIEMSHQMLQIHHDHASFVPGYVQDFYRMGHWRWVRYPDFFNHRVGDANTVYFLHWIDTDMKEATLEARENGETFEPVINVHDQWREQ